MEFNITAHLEAVTQHIGFDSGATALLYIFERSLYFFPEHCGQVHLLRDLWFSLSAQYYFPLLASVTCQVDAKVVCFSRMGLLQCSTTMLIISSAHNVILYFGVATILRII